MEEKRLSSAEQLKAVVNFIVDNHHAVRELKNFSKNFTLTPEDLEHIDKMVANDEPIFIIVHEILERHHKNTNKHPSLKSVAEIFTKMGLQRLAGNISLCIFWKSYEQRPFAMS